MFNYIDSWNTGEGHVYILHILLSANILHKFWILNWWISGFGYNGDAGTSLPPLPNIFPLYEKLCVMNIILHTSYSDII